MGKSRPYKTDYVADHASAMPRDVAFSEEHSTSSHHLYYSGQKGAWIRVSRARGGYKLEWYQGCPC